MYAGAISVAMVSRAGAFIGLLFAGVSVMMWSVARYSSALWHSSGASVKSSSIVSVNEVSVVRSAGARLAAIVVEIGGATGTCMILVCEGHLGAAVVGDTRLGWEDKRLVSMQSVGGAEI